MDKFDFSTFLESTGKELQAQIEKAIYYQHPSGVGDAREDFVRNYLEQVLPSRFSVDRGKVIDSEGRLTKEFDVIISERSDVVPAMSTAGRRIIPIEAVYGVIEIKSKLNMKGYRTFIDAVIELDQMIRFYKPIKPDLNPDLKAKLEKGISAQDTVFGRIWSGLIAFDAPKGKTLSKYLAKCCEGFWFVCIPGREIVLLRVDPIGFAGIGSGMKSFPLLVWVIMDFLTGSTRRFNLAPNFSKYRDNIVEKWSGAKVIWECVDKSKKDYEKGTGA